MKMNRTLLVAVVTTLSGLLQLTAQQSGAMAFNNLEKAGKIIGMVITDSRNQPVGKVNNLAVDLQEGRIAEVLVNTGGFLTAKQRIIAVPPESFMLTHSNEKLRLNADIDTFDNAPAFDISTWDLSTTSSSVADVYHRFHAQPYPHMGRLEPAGKIMDLTARNAACQRMGKVEDLMVSLPSGRIPEVIIASTGFFGIKKNELTAVPPQVFLYDPDYNALLLDTTKKALRHAPHFKPGDWRYGVNNFLSPSAVDDAFPVLRSLNAEGTDNAAPDTVIASRAGDGDTEGDTAITIQIEHKILVTDGLSMDARHVQVITQKGRVTLRGVADSEKEKLQLGGIAASVVPADHVDNRIEVKIFAVATIQL
jgi:sporulation protein YlmC with PRC-barrel domain